MTLGRKSMQDKLSTLSFDVLSKTLLSLSSEESLNVIHSLIQVNHSLENLFPYLVDIWSNHTLKTIGEHLYKNFTNNHLNLDKLSLYPSIKLINALQKNPKWEIINQTLKSFSDNTKAQFQTFLRAISNENYIDTSFTHNSLQIINSPLSFPFIQNSSTTLKKLEKIKENTFSNLRPKEIGWGLLLHLSNKGIFDVIYNNIDSRINPLLRTQKNHQETCKELLTSSCAMTLIGAAFLYYLSLQSINGFSYLQTAGFGVSCFLAAAAMLGFLYCAVTSSRNLIKTKQDITLLKKKKEIMKESITLGHEFNFFNQKILNASPNPLPRDHVHSLSQ